MVSISLEGSGDNLAVTKAKSTFENTAGGRLYHIGGLLDLRTRWRYSHADDPNNPKDVESEAKNALDKSRWRDVWQSRLDDAKAGAMIVVQQRVSEKTSPT
ncbi:hypothetical protein [Candidatus Bealeia paramacronuclearis]|uniref:hypothetical protein n=1 Tax=Candidatus Bealeia paramacronuclearis TaxID=1921001 RepID=UPI0030CFBF5A